MKTTILLLIFSFFLLSVQAQQTGLRTYVLKFNDKGVDTDAALNPSLYLTEKSIERRSKQKIGYDQSDIPVNEQYVNDVSKTGAHILARSRWLNTIVVEATPEMIEKIALLSVISEIELINGSHMVTENKNSKPFFASETITPASVTPTKKSVTDVFNYGEAFNQINQLKGQYLHNNGFSGQGMTIAVLDAGFNSVDIMTCFDSLRANNQIKGTRDMAEPGNNVYGTSMHTHGTSVLSCMGAYASGIMVGTAPKADYWLIRTEVGEYEEVIEEYFWVSGAEFADSIGADLINSSLGYTEFGNSLTSHTYADMDGNTSIVTIGADKAAEKGILVVNSAGNSGAEPWRYIGAPADGDSVFTIGAVDKSGNRVSFSSVGPTSDGRIKPTVAAQGYGSAIFSPGGLGFGSGTSFSSPITCGITACLWQALPDLNNMQIIEAMKTSASQAWEADSLLGWGIPDMEKAYTTLSIREHQANDRISVYPNPVINSVTIDFPVRLSGKYTIEIINLQSKVVYTYSGIENSLQSLQLNDMNKLPSGIYLVKIMNGVTQYSERIIKI